MMDDYCTQHDQNWLIHLRYITTDVQYLWTNGHKCFILAQSQDMFYMNQMPIAIDYCTKCEQNQHILL